MIVDIVVAVEEEIEDIVDDKVGSIESDIEDSDLLSFSPMAVSVAIIRTAHNNVRVIFSTPTIT